MPEERAKAKRRSWWRTANRMFGARNIIWIQGDGPWALVSTCPPGLTITLWNTYPEAQRQKGYLKRHCGHECCGPLYHPIHFLVAGRQSARRATHCGAKDAKT